MTTRPAASAIRYGTGRDVDTVTRLLAEAFLHGDFGPWLVPDPHDRAAIYLDYFRIFVEHALTAGRIELTTDEDAAAVWYTHGPLHIPGYDQRLAAAVGARLPRFQALDAAMDAGHPAGPEHHYLAFLAVRPDRQNTGLGTALLRHHHAYLDARGLPAFLEATGSANRRLYERHGYRPRAPYQPAPDSPRLHPMWREPGPAN